MLFKCSAVEAGTLRLRHFEERKFSSFLSYFGNYPPKVSLEFKTLQVCLGLLRENLIFLTQNLCWWRISWQTYISKCKIAKNEKTQVRLQGLSICSWLICILKYFYYLTEPRLHIKWHYLLFFIGVQIVIDLNVRNCDTIFKQSISIFGIFSEFLVYWSKLNIFVFQDDFWPSLPFGIGLTT